jgi:hypothetical protein
MNLIDRYVAEVSKRLPKKNRRDIQEEIRSTLDDMLDDRVQKAGHPADEEMMVTLLKEFGKPEAVAASYVPAQQLIGPQLYPIYLLILKIVLPIVSTVLLVMAGIGLATAGLTVTEMVEAAGKALLEVAGAVISAVGSITITFAILDRIPGFRSEIEKDKKTEEKDWDPRDLPEVRDVEKFSLPGLMVEIVLNAAVLIVLNFFPQIIGFGFLLNDEWTFLPVLSDAFFRYLPFINALFGLEIVLNLYLLRLGRWQTATRWLHTTLKALWVALAAVMLAGPELVNSSAEAVSLLGPRFSLEAANFLLLLPRWIAKGTLALIIVLDGIEVVNFLFQEMRGKPHS